MSPLAAAEASPSLGRLLEGRGQLDDLANADRAPLIPQCETPKLRHILKHLGADGLLHLDARNDHAAALHELGLHQRTTRSVFLHLEAWSF